jgi:hypothetical protein
LRHFWGRREEEGLEWDMVRHGVGCSKYKSRQRPILNLLMS